MSEIGAIFQVLPTYLRASAYGRRYLRGLQKKLRHEASGPAADYLRDRWQRSLLLRNFAFCDRCFCQWIPKGIHGSMGTDRFQIYQRLIPFAWIGQAVRTRLLEAFDLAYDEAAEERSVLQSFIHREWNDLFDRFGLKYEDLDFVNKPALLPRSEMALYRSLCERFRLLVPQEQFPRYFRMIETAPQIVSLPTSPKTAASATAEKGHHSARLALYIMRDVLPDTLERVLPAFGFWLFSLDEFSDLERDACSGRTTHMSTVNDPERELQRIYAEMEKQVTAAAPYPRRLLDYLENLQQDMLRLKKKGIDIESRFLHVD